MLPVRMVRVTLRIRCNRRAFRAEFQLVQRRRCIPRGVCLCGWTTTLWVLKHRGRPWRPDVDRAIVATRSEHESVRRVIPRDAGQVAATKGLWADVVQKRGRFAVPYVDLATLIRVSDACQNSPESRTFRRAKYQFVGFPAEIAWSSEVDRRLWHISMT